MAWARVVRGTSSIANSVAPRSAIAGTVGTPASGVASPITIWPGCVSATASSSTCTRSKTRAASASARLTTSAPLSAKAASLYPAASPAPCSTSTRAPALSSGASAAGLMATRRSPSRRSRTTPTVNPPGSVLIVPDPLVGLVRPVSRAGDNTSAASVSSWCGVGQSGFAIRRIRDGRARPARGVTDPGGPLPYLLARRFGDSSQRSRQSARMDGAGVPDRRGGGAVSPAPIRPGVDP